MSLIRPFRALRPTPALAAEVAAVPYDVVNREESAALAKDRPWSFLHVSRAEIDLPQVKDAYDPSVYDRARANWDRLRQEAPLIEEDEPSLYIYRLRQGAHEQTGIAGTFAIDEYDTDLIKKHERTRKEKEDDRTRHLLALGAQTGPVFLAFRSNTAIQIVVDRIVATTEPIYRFVAPDGVTHTMWKAPPADRDALVTGFAHLDALYIADGHHRAASASRARAELRAQGKGSAAGPENYVLAVAFAARELAILPYFRVITDLDGRRMEDILKRITQDFEIQDLKAPDPKAGEFAMLTLEGGTLRWRRLAPRQAAPADPIAALDVSVLQDRILGPIFGIQDPRTDKRIDFVGGIRGTKELERLVTHGQAVVAFAVHPTRLEELFRVSDAGGIMPPKSTWFEPKLRDGLLSHQIV